MKDWAHSDTALVEALRALVEKERSRQESLRLENNKYVIQILDMASKLEIRASDIPLLFSTNSELASKLVSCALEELRVPSDGQESLQKQHLASLSARPDTTFRSPKTPSRHPAYEPSGNLPSSIQTAASTTQCGSPTNSVTPSTTLRSTHRGTFIQTSPFVPQQDPQNLQVPQLQHQPQQQSSSEQQQVPIYHFEQRESPESHARGHRHALSALPAYGPMSPSSYPLPSPKGRGMVQGFYPGQLMPPRLTQMSQMHPPLSNMTPPNHQQQSPQLVAIQPPAGYALNAHIPTTGPPPLSGPISAAPPSTSPPNGSTPSQISPTYLHQGQQQQREQAMMPPPPLMYHRVAPSVDSLGGGLHGACAAFGDRETAGVKRTLPSSGSASNLEPPAGRPKTHRSSLSRGAELQIHQWKPKQILRDNRWKITNPFTRTKEKRSSNQASGQSVPQNGKTGDASTIQPKKAGPAANDQKPIQPRPPHLESTVVPQTQPPLPSCLSQDLSSPQRPVQAQMSPIYSQSSQQLPHQPAACPPSSAAVVAAQNNRRRSITHARRRSAASLPAVVEPAPDSEDAHRHDEGVAVLASLATEQWRRSGGATKTSEMPKQEVDPPALCNAPKGNSSQSPKNKI